MSHGVTHYHESLNALNRHAGGANQANLGNSLKYHISQAPPGDTLNLQALKALGPEECAFITRACNHGMKEHLQTIRDNSLPESLRTHIAKKEQEYYNAHSEYLKERTKITNGNNGFEDYEKSEAWNKAEAAIWELRTDKSLTEERRAKLGATRDKVFTKADAPEDVSKLQKSYDKLLDHHEEWQALLAKSPADFIKEESVREFNDLEKNLSETESNTSKAFEELQKAPLTKAERGALRTYFQEMKDDAKNINAHTTKLRTVFNKKTDNYAALENALKVEDLYNIAKSNREDFINKSKDMQNFLKKRETDLANAHQNGYTLRTPEVDALKQENHDLDIANAALDQERQRLTTDLRTTKANETAKTKDAESQKTQKRVAWGLGATAFTASLGIIWYLLDKQSKAANPASYGAYGQ